MKRNHESKNAKNAKADHQEFCIKVYPPVLQEFYKEQLSIIEAEKLSEESKTLNEEQKCKVTTHFEGSDVILTIFKYFSPNLRVCDTIYVKKISANSDNRHYGSIMTIKKDGQFTTLTIRLAELLNDRAVKSLIDPTMKVGIWNDLSKYKDMQYSLKKFIANNENDGSKKFPDFVQKIILNQSTERGTGEHHEIIESFLNTLNFKPSKAQIKAIEDTMNNRLTIIQGAPGTGKSLTIYGTVKYMSCVNNNIKVCIISAKHSACDNLMKIFKKKNGFESDYDVMQLKSEHYRAISHDRQFCLSSVIEEEIGNLNTKKLLRNDSFHAYQQAIKGLLGHRSSRDNSDGNSWSEKERILKQKVKNCFIKLQYEFILDHVKVLVSTFIAALGRGKVGPKIKWSLIVVEESSCVIPPNMLMAAINVEPENGKLLLVGDIKQLDPFYFTVGFNDYDNYKIHDEYVWTLSPSKRSILFRLQQEYRIPSVFLDVQRRMMPEIFDFSNQSFYQNRVLNQCPNLHEAAWKLKIKNSKHHTIFVNVNGSENQTNVNEEDGNLLFRSHENKKEAEAVYKILDRLKHLNISPQDITVLSTYNGQVRLLQSMLSHEHVIKSVDSYQGCENRIVIVSFVRTNEIGFLKYEGRVNVAITRATDILILVGNLNFFCTQSKSTLSKLANYYKINKTVYDLDCINEIDLSE